MNAKEVSYSVAVIGAGPAGLYAARQLALQGVKVVLINRDIKPGGLAEYGIYHDKHKMKEGLRSQFRQILEMPEITYYGNVTIGKEGDISLEELQNMGFQGIMVTVGAQGTKWLGLPGENLKGVYHAKDIVYHYNKLPPYSTYDYYIGRQVAIVGVGNVMMDIAHWTIRELKVDEVTAVARRGPAEVKFTKKEMANVIRNLDLEDLESEFNRVADRMRAVGQNPEEAKEYILSALPKALEPISSTRFRFRFLSSPKRILGDTQGKVCGLEVENTALELKNGDTKAVGLGTTYVLDVDTVVFCIGDRVDEKFGLPVQWNAFVKNPQPRFPVDGISFEAYDPEKQAAIPGVFVAGWAREASSGLVGVARKDGEMGAEALMQYLHTLKPLDRPTEPKEKLEARLKGLNKKVVTKEDVAKLEEAERAEAQKLGVEEFKFKTNEEMLAVITA